MAKTTTWRINFTFDGDLQGTASVNARSVGGAINQFNLAKTRNTIPTDSVIYFIKKEES